MNAPLAAWNDLTSNPLVVLGYYSEPPSLDEVEVHSIAVHRDAATVMLTIEVPRFPDRPSPRWPLESNAVQLELRFIDVENLQLTGWSTNNIGRLVVSRHGAERIAFELRTDDVSLRGDAGAFDVVKVRLREGQLMERRRPRRLAGRRPRRPELARTPARLRRSTCLQSASCGNCCCSF